MIKSSKTNARSHQKGFQNVEPCVKKVDHVSVRGQMIHISGFSVRMGLATLTSLGCCSEQSPDRILPFSRKTTKQTGFTHGPRLLGPWCRRWKWKEKRMQKEIVCLLIRMISNIYFLVGVKTYSKIYQFYHFFKCTVLGHCTCSHVGHPPLFPSPEFCISPNWNSVPMKQ